MINFFEEAPAGSYSRNPFVEEYAEKNPADTSLHLVISVGRNRKRTGYMVNTDKFTIFLYEGSKVLTQLLEALAVLHETGHGYKLYAQTSKEDPYYKLGIDQEQPTNWYAERGKYFINPEVSTTGLEEQQNTNPFLPTPSSTKTRHKRTS